MTKMLEYRGRDYSVAELSEISGITPATIRYRLRRGYSVEEAVKIVATSDSIKEFSEASYWKDWVGMPINGLYEIYWKWSVSHGYAPLPKQGFSRQIFQMFPNLKSIPNKVNGVSVRIVKEK